MEIVKHRNKYFAVSGVLITASLLSLIFFGIRLGIDFTGGSLMEVVYEENRLSNSEVREKLVDLALGQINIQPTGDNGLIIRTKDVNESTHQEILSRLGSPMELRFESVGPLIGSELRQKALWAIVWSLIAIIIYIAWAFRRVSKPVASWQYGLVAIIALFHDIFITLGFFSLYSYFNDIEIGLAFVAAFLTILGYSVNNSIVIFDRTRENLIKTNWTDFGSVVNDSINQSLTRCLNTALTTLLVLIAIFFFGGASIKYFALALILGIIIGTYSSIFITGSMIVAWQNRRVKND